MGQIDPITLEVVRGYLVSTVLQMRATLARTAYAPILYETRDFSCGLLAPNGELAAMSEDIAGHIFAMSLGLKAAMAKFHDDIYPGDVLAVNDPYTGGTHLNDVAFYLPYFIDGKLLLFILVRAHFADIGGATPGSFSGQDTEIYQEGVRLVPVKIVERGKINRGLWDVIFANMRLQEEREGDALAMLDTARVAEAAVSELCAKYGPETIGECIQVFLDSAEEVVRSRISELAPGDYYYEHYIDNDGHSKGPMPVKVKLTIRGSSMTFDFAGSAPQSVGPVNCGVPVTMAGVFVVVKSWLDASSPVNGGTFRPLKFIIPEGSCMAAQLPAAVGGCWEVNRAVESAVVGLFSQITPQDVGAEVQGGANHIFIAGYDELRRKPYILYEYPYGGYPATSNTDGADGCVHYDAGDIPLVQPAESVEQRQPLLVECLAVSTDREGPGRRRSGRGVTRRVMVLSETAQLNVMTDRAIIPPWGTAGAYPGSVNSFAVIREGQEIQPSLVPGKVKGSPLQYGDVVLMQATAGGGVGDPLDRDVELVGADVFEEYLTAERAREVYGVVVGEAGHVDEAKTQEQRQELRKRRQYFDVTNGGSDDYDERGCRICRLSPRSAGRIGVGDGDMVEYVGHSTAPLRAWARVVDDVQGEGVPLGPIGRKILRVEPGDLIRIRSLGIESLV